MSFSGIWASSTRIFLWLWSHFSSWNLLETDSQTQRPGRWEWVNAGRRHKSTLLHNAFFPRVLSHSPHTRGDCVRTSQGTAEKAAITLNHCSWGQNTHTHTHTHSVPKACEEVGGRAWKVTLPVSLQCWWASWRPPSASAKKNVSVRN